jgi:hypothetical protein
MTENKVEDDSFISKKRCSQSKNHVTLFYFFFFFLQYKNFSNIRTPNHSLEELLKLYFPKTSFNHGFIQF